MDEKTWPTADFFNFPLYQPSKSAEGMLPPADKVLVFSAEVLDESARELLAKILAAVQCKLSEEVILQEGGDLPRIADLQRLQAQFRLLAFGYRPADFGLQIRPPWYHCLQWGQAQLLFADSIHKLDQTRKKQLWEGLKNMFSI